MSTLIFTHFPWICVLHYEVDDGVGQVYRLQLTSATGNRFYVILPLSSYPHRYVGSFSFLSPTDLIFLSSSEPILESLSFSWTLWRNTILLPFLWVVFIQYLNNVWFPKKESKREERKKMADEDAMRKIKHLEEQHYLMQKQVATHKQVWD